MPSIEVVPTTLAMTVTLTLEQYDTIRYDTVDLRALKS